MLQDTIFDNRQVGLRLQSVSIVLIIAQKTHALVVGKITTLGEREFLIDDALAPNKASHTAVSLYRSVGNDDRIDIISHSLSHSIALEEHRTDIKIVERSSLLHLHQSLGKLLDVGNQGSLIQLLIRRNHTVIAVVQSRTAAGAHISVNTDFSIAIASLLLDAFRIETVDVAVLAVDIHVRIVESRIFQEDSREFLSQIFQLLIADRVLRLRIHIHIWLHRKHIRNALFLLRTRIVLHVVLLVSLRIQTVLIHHVRSLPEFTADIVVIYLTAEVEVGKLTRFHIAGVLIIAQFQRNTTHGNDRILLCLDDST